MCNLLLGQANLGAAEMMGYASRMTYDRRDDNRV